jgi:hypothetical protein
MKRKHIYLSPQNNVHEGMAFFHLCLNAVIGKRFLILLYVPDVFDKSRTVGLPPRDFFELLSRHSGEDGIYLKVKQGGYDYFTEIQELLSQRRENRKFHFIVLSLSDFEKVEDTIEVATRITDEVISYFSDVSLEHRATLAISVPQIEEGALLSDTFQREKSEKSGLHIIYRPSYANGKCDWCLRRPDMIRAEFKEGTSPAVAEKEMLPKE